jgi:predicted DNA-binding mobile mystery protein A
MSSAELAARIGVSQQRVSQIEHNEVHETITLVTLRRAANALDCDLVYVLEPRTSLNEAVREQAHGKAVRHLAPVSHHNRLEDQSLSTARTKQLSSKSSRPGSSTEEACGQKPMTVSDWPRGPSR